MTERLPAHVPPELVVDIDYFLLTGPDDADAQIGWKKFTGKGPLVYSPRNGGHWVATEGADVAAMFRDSASFSNAGGITIPAHAGEPLLPVESDPPEHASYRRAIMPFFSPANVAKVEVEIRQLVIGLIEAMRPNGECEFVSAFAEQLPLITFLRLLGLPEEDRIVLQGFARPFAQDPDVMVKQQAYLALEGYVVEQIRKRRANPSEDAISAVIAARVGDRPYTEREIVSTCMLLLLGGLDTVTASLGFFATHLARHPDDRAYIRDHRANLRPVINELARRYPVAILGRSVTKDMDYRGVQLKAGDRILLSPALHGLDPGIFPDAERVDFTRRPNHITFGSGVHSCIGADLARAEFNLFLQEWLDRIPDFEIKAGTTPKIRTAQTSMVDELWLSWTIS